MGGLRLIGMSMAAEEHAAVRWMALAVGVLAVVVLAGYGLRSVTLVELRGGANAAMVPSAAVSLILGALALALSGRWKTVCTLLLLGLNGAILAQNVAGVQLGVDFSSLIGWVREPSLHPGRMPGLVNIGLLLFGAGVFVAPRTRRRGRGWIVRWLTWLAMAAGMASVAGYFVELELLYDFRSLTRPALHSGAGIFVLSLGLWLSWREQRWNRPPADIAQASGIFSAATLAFVVVIAASGFSALLLIQRTARRDAATDLILRRNERADYIRTLVTDAVGRGALYAEQELPRARLLGRSIPATGNAAPTMFSSITLLRDGRVVDEMGTPVQAGAARVRVPLGTETSLLWDGEFYLRQRLAVEHNGRTIGTVVLEQPLPLLGAIGVETAAFGSSGEIGLCGRAAAGGEEIVCFPRRSRPEPFVLPRPRIGLAEPMRLAMDGQTGTVGTLDFRGERVLAAYGPVPTLGLGLVVKMDSRELYAPIRWGIEILGPLLIGLAVAGYELLRWRVRPLVRQLVQSRNLVATSEARFRAAAESGMDPFYIFESERDAASGRVVGFRLIYANQPGEELARLEPRAGHAMTLASVPQLQAAGAAFEHLRSVVSSRDGWTEEFPLPERRGDRRGLQAWFHVQAVPLGDGVAVTLRDISKRKQEEERLRIMAQTDALTGLANREALHQRLVQAMEEVRREASHRMMALLYLDVDRFKEINDTFGHTFGDQVLRAFSARLLRSVRSVDTLARVGGDEFAILLEKLDSERDAERVVAAIFAAVEDPMHLERQQVRISTSVGLCYYRGENLSAAELVRRADAALYTAKRGGRNRWQVWDPATV